jgi:hypothetical protein
MAQLQLSLNLPSPRDFNNLAEVRNYLDDLQSALYDQISSLFNEFSGSIDLTNLKWKIVSVTSDATPDTDFTVTHNLGETAIDIPSLFFYQINSESDDFSSAVVRKGSAAWTNETITLRCNVASTPLLVLVIM